jgi:hypothetical protein
LEARLAPAVSFAAQQAFPAGNTPEALALTDLNGDGKLDIIVGDQNGNNGRVAVLLNTTPAGSTTLSFAAPQTFAVGGLPNSFAVADFNGDGRPDLAVVNASDNTMSVLLNTTPVGSSTLSFTPQQTYAVGNGPRIVVAADFNGDGRPDLAVCNFHGDTVAVFLNTTASGAAAASFAAPQNLPVGIGPDAMVVADFNGDGRPDLAVANFADHTVSVLLDTTTAGASTFSFAPQATFAIGTQPEVLAVADFNGDARPDLAASIGIPYAASVLLNTTAHGAAAASFAALATFAAGPQSDCVGVGDFDGDGRPDIVIGNDGDGTMSVLVNTTVPEAATATFADQVTFAAGNNFLYLAVGDLNGDGLPDIVTVDNPHNEVVVLVNTTVNPPTANSQSVTVGQGLARTVTLTATPFNGDPLTFQITSGPAHGTLSGLNAATGQVTYTPNAGYSGPDSFQFTATDTTSNLTSAAATVSITVLQLPTAAAQSVIVGQNMARNLTLSGTAPNGDPLTFSLASNPGHGTLSNFNSTTGAVTYTPNAGFAGTDSFTFTVTDTTTNLTSAVAIVTLTVAAPPVPNPGAATVAQGQPATLTLTGSPSSPNDPLTFTVTVAPAHGTLSSLSSTTGRITYTSLPNYVGPDSFQFTVTDTVTGLTSTGTAAFSLTVVPAPLADPQFVGAVQGQSVPLTLTGSAPNGDAFTFTLTSQPAHGTLNGFNANTGTVTYTPAGTYAGTDRFAFSVTDTVTNLTSAPATVSLTVSAARALVAQFGNQGVWQYDRTTSSWAQLTPANAALLATDGSGDVAAEFPGYGLWEYQPSSGWQRLHSVDVSLLAMNAAGTIAVQFPGYGVGLYSPAAGWRLLTGANASLLAIDANGDIAAEFPHYGVWEFLPSSGWQQLHTVDVTLLAMDPQGDVAANFPGYGVGEYGPAGGWRLLNGTQATSVALDAGGDLVAEFAGYGVGEYVAASGSWRALTAANAAALAADAAGNFYGEFIGYGVWQYDPTRGWVQLRTTDAAVLAAR